MALYRIGTAAMDAQGVITGTGTKWREPLSLIRTGATIVFLEQPVIQLAVISEIISDTEMKAISTDGAVVPDGKYVILLNDSLTVDGMAQDVAETLRYYQSKETVIEEAIEFFKNFDLKGLQDLVNQINADAQHVAIDKAATEQLKNDTQQIKDSAVSETQQIKDAAVNETNQIKADTDAIKTQTQQIKDNAVAEIGEIRNDAINSRDGAEGAQLAAEQSSIASENAKQGAETARDEARQWAQQVNPENLLHKDQNLSDVESAEESRANLNVPSTSEVFLKKDNLEGIADRAAAWLNVRPIGSTPLSGDPVGPYDAATRRWVENLLGAGIAGPTMNGVMNYGVGKPSLNASRSYIAPYELPMDGQLVKRADWPELWSHAQMHGAIEDSEWISTRTLRGKYSNGDGSTTFRLPDWNGKRRSGDMIDGVPFSGADSIHALFARGDGVDASDNAGTKHGSIRQSAIPALRGIVYSTGAGVFAPGRAGALEGSNSLYQVPSSAPGSSGGANTLTIDGSWSNAAYGRDNSPEVRPNSVLSVWVVRASGGFVAANTSWSVINADETIPSDGVVVYGGSVWSQYKVANADYVKLGYRAKVTIGGAASGELILNDNRSGSVIKTWGIPTESGTLLCSSDVGTYGHKIPFLDGQNTWNKLQIHKNSGILLDYESPNTSLPDKSGPVLASMVSTGGSSRLEARFFCNFNGEALRRAIIQVTSDNTVAQTFSLDQLGNIASAKGLVQFQGSDVRIKYGFEPPKPGAWERVKKIGIMEFYYNGDNVRQRGFIAQQMNNVDETYTFIGGHEINEDGDYFDVMNVNDRAVMSDVITVVQKLQDENERLNSELSDLKSSIEQMQELLSSLTMQIKTQ